MLSLSRVQRKALKWPLAPRYNLLNAWYSILSSPGSFMLCHYYSSHAGGKNAVHEVLVITSFYPPMPGIFARFLTASIIKFQTKRWKASTNHLGRSDHECCMLVYHCCFGFGFLCSKLQFHWLETNVLDWWASPRWPSKVF